MTTHSVNSVLFAVLAFFLVSLLPFSQSFSTVAISETANGTLICAIARSGGRYDQQSSTFLNCSAFPQRTRIAINTSFAEISGIVGGNGFVCAVGSLYPSSVSVMVCLRFSTPARGMNYKRIYLGSALKDLDSGNSLICGLVDGSKSNSLQCWNRRDFNFNYTTNAISSSLAVGENFVCGLSEFGQVRCFGSDNSVTDDSPSGTFSQVKASSRHACAISLDGGVECWGQMEVKRPIIGEFTLLAMGESRSCGIRRNGTAICWGENGFSLPESLRDEHFIAIEAKGGIFCGVLTVNFSLLCWGREDLDSNPLVLTGAVPGPCTTSNECACGPLPLSAEYCAPGLMICEPCVRQPRRINPPPPSLPAAPATSSRAGNWSGGTVASLVVGCVGSLSLLLVLGIFLFLRYFKTRGRRRIHDSGSLETGRPVQQSGQTAQMQSNPLVLEKKLSNLINTGNGDHLEEFPIEALRKATENFSDERKIGGGSFGSVYRATLDDGRLVAIKRAETSASSSTVATIQRGLVDKGNAFLNELDFLSRLNHKNLIRLFGFCDDDEELVLVYEYMENGSVFDHLHKLQDSPLMSWSARIKIALDAARGIEYLHEYAVPCVIHRDIKSSNILLDASWTAKVSDFGLSRPQDDDESNLCLRAAGTMGYIDPEYYRLQVLTRKSDVYSFGVVLLELLSGRKAIHKNDNETGVLRNVVDYVVPYVIRDEVHRVLDTRVPPPNPVEMDAVAYVGYLAADCVMPEGRNRPTMREVADSLDRAMVACMATPGLSWSTSTTASSVLLVLK